MSFVAITRVLLLDNVDPAAKEILEKNGIEATLCKEKLSKDSLISELQGYDGVVVRSATRVTAEIIEACPKLNIIGRAGTGVDNIDVQAATRQGVAVMNTPGGNTISAAEHTCTLICCLSRNVPAADAHVKAGNWDRKAFMGHELFGKVLAIVGLGRIGLEVARRMQSFGMTTIGFDPIVSAETAKEYDVEWMELANIWPLADYITVHTPLIPQTKGMINSKVFAMCKPGVRIVNCARGGIVDEDSLLAALESGECGGAGLDVFVEEPTKNTALIKHPKVIACPHLGASTKEGQARCGMEIAQQLVDASVGRSFFGVINAPALSSATSTNAGSWMSIARGLAYVTKEFMVKAKNYKITLSTSGNELHELGRSLKSAISAGLLQNKQANLINAPILCEELGLEIKIKHTEDQPQFCVLESSTDGKSLKLSGRVADNKPALCAINGYTLSAPICFQGCILFYKAPSNESAMQAVMSTLADEEIVVEQMSSTQPQNGCRWIIMVLCKKVSNMDALSQKVDEATQIVF